MHCIVPLFYLLIVVVFLLAMTNDLKSFSAPSAFIETLRDRMFKPSLSTIISENSKYFFYLCTIWPHLLLELMLMRQKLQFFCPTQNGGTETHFLSIVCAKDINALLIPIIEIITRKPTSPWFYVSLNSVAKLCPRVATVLPSDPVSVAAKRMQELQVNSVIIMAGNNIQGILT